MRGLLAFTLFVYVMTGYVLQLSSAWHSQTYPTPEAQVRLNDGAVLKGDLYRSWDGDWILKQDGVEINVPEKSVQSVGVQQNVDHLTYSQMWRLWLPVVAFLTICISIAILPTIKCFFWLGGVLRRCIGNCDHVPHY